MKSNYLKYYYNKMFHPLAMVYTFTVSFFFCFMGVFIGQIFGYFIGVCELSIECTFISFPMAIFGFFILHYLSFYRNKIKNHTAEFTYKEFRDWYKLNPNRIVFSEYGSGFYYLFNPENKEYQSHWDISDYSYLQPKTFVDYVRFAYFIHKQFLVGKPYGLLNFENDVECVD